MPDVTVTDHGTIVAFTFNSDAAKQFADEQIQAESWQYFYFDTLCVDARYAEDLVTGMQNDGLTVEVN